jgi:thymidine phosphorylase
MEISKFIETKQKGKNHTKEEIDFFIKNLDVFNQDDITQWLKAVKANGLNDDETSALTLAMANSGEILNWDDVRNVVDKHSTGGIGDKVTLLFVPLNGIQLLLNFRNIFIRQKHIFCKAVPPLKYIPSISLIK